MVQDFLGEETSLHHEERPVLKEELDLFVLETNEAEAAETKIPESGDVHSEIDGLEDLQFGSEELFFSEFVVSYVLDDLACVDILYFLVLRGEHETDRSQQVQVLRRNF